jgi:hypothetical protein
MPTDKNPESSPARKRAPRKRGSTAENAAISPVFVDPPQRAALIARAAYFRALERGFEPGHELEDWLAAESQVDAELLRGSAESAQA